MKICLVIEGSFPYIVGGVSSWVNDLILHFPQHEFVLYCIGAKEEDRGNFQYTIPSNVIAIKEVFLDSFLGEKGKYGKRYKLKDNNSDLFIDMLSGVDIKWHKLFDFLRGIPFKNVSEFLMSKDFYDIIREVYDCLYDSIPFTEYFWSIRSMLLPMIQLIVEDIEEADVYHSVAAGYAGMVASLGSYLYNKPYLLTEHGIYSREREEEIIQATWVKGYLKDMWISFFGSLGKCSYNCANQVVTLFGKNKEIEEEMGCDPHKIMIIHNGINVKKYENMIMEYEKDGFINIGAVVRVVPIKDIKTMIEAFSQVKAEVGHCRFYIMGPIDEDKSYYEECMQLVDSLGVADIIFTGKIDIKSYLGWMDMLVLTSISEGQPLALLEGMACHKPFVTTDVGSCKELLYGLDDDYGKAGIVVPVMDVAGISKAMIALCHDSDLRREMGDNGFIRVSKLYTHERFISQYDRVYSRLVDVWQV